MASIVVAKIDEPSQNLPLFVNFKAWAYLELVKDRMDVKGLPHCETKMMREAM